MEDKRIITNKDNGRIAGGVILILVGAALFARNMDYGDLPRWLFTWPMILILVGIHSGIKHNFSNTGWIIVTAIGLFFLVEKFIPGLRLEPAFWPLVIVGIGLLFIIRPRKKNIWNRRGSDEADEELNPLTTIENPQTFPPGGHGAEVLRIDSVFSGVDRTILSKNFQGGKIACVFGGAEIDLLKADISGRVLLKIDVVFGGVKLIVPAHWTVRNEIDGAFHSVDDKRKYIPGIDVDAGKILHLKGSCVFGGIEIKSY